MRPSEVADDAVRRARFHNEVAYLDRPHPTDEEVQEDADLLGSADGLLVIAWLWPEVLYLHDIDPFDHATRTRQTLPDADASTQSDRADGSLESASRQIDLRRQARRGVMSRRFARILDSTARAVGRDLEDLMTHLRWSTPLTERELRDLISGHSPFPFQVIIRLCNVLQLEFVDGWTLVDPDRLAHLIDQSILASRISEQLGRLAIDNLESLLGKLPRASASRPPEPRLHRGPEPRARYSSLYEALVRDERTTPRYTIDELDQLLIEAGEPPLPSSARSDRFWWAGSSTQTEGRPQIRTWWAAGYRISDVGTDPSSERIESIGFEALPGRAEWLNTPERAQLLANLQRTELREYRVPSPAEVPIYPLDAAQIETLKAALGVFAEKLEYAAQIHANFITNVAPAMTELLVSRLDALQARDNTTTTHDPAIQQLVLVLIKLGEASRAQLINELSKVRGEPVEETWLSNLLTKARRQGWIVNRGTRSQPRWTASEQATKPSCPACGQHTLHPYTTTQLKCSNCATIARVSAASSGSESQP